MSNKVKIARNLADSFEALTETECNKFSRLVNKLLRETFILKNKDSDKMDYYDISAHFYLYFDYFALMDYELINDTNHSLFYIKTLQDRNRVQLYKFETVVALILRRLFYSKAKEINSNGKIIVSLDEIIDQMKIAQIYKDEKKITSFTQCLRLFRRYKIVDFAASKIDENTQIEIYPTIQIIIPQDSIEDIALRINSLKKEDRGETDEDTYED